MTLLAFLDVGSVMATIRESCDKLYPRSRDRVRRRGLLRAYVPE